MNSPRQLIKYITVELDHLDELNHVNNVVFLKFVQDIAISHWVETVPDDIRESIRWIAKRHEIDYKGQAFLGDTLTIKTWVSEFKGLSSFRHCEIYKENKLILKSLSQWVAINALSLKPERLKIDLTPYFFET